MDLSINSTADNRPQCQWNKIDWKQAYQTVRKLRGRIFKATKRGDAKTARRLQKLLLNSYENRLLAVRQISQINVGKKTPGLDKLLVHTPTERGILVDQLVEIRLNNWKPQPDKRIYIPKANGKLRPLGIPSILDRCLQYIVKSALEPEWEAKFERHTYGFRPGRSCHDALHRVYNNCANSRAKKVWILNANISGCFDKISHQFILEAIGQFPARTIIEGWLKCGYVDRNVFHPTIQATPQGGVISPLLANIALHGMDIPLGIKYLSRGDTLGNRGLVRYADDCIVFCESEKDAKDVSEILNKWLSSRGLSLSKEKTTISHIDDGFDFLGTNVRRYHISDTKTRLLIKPSKRSILKCQSKLKALWVQGYGKPATLTMRRLNAFIRGWANYFRMYISKDVFSSLDNKMFSWAIRYTRRTHPLKSWRWRKEKYFGRFNLTRKDRWTFGDKGTGHYLVKFAWFPIQRHTMIKGDNSPDNPDLSEYWEKRNQSNSKLEFTTQFDQKIASNQNHVCPLCKQSLYNGEELHRHHKTPLRKGGKDVTSNIVFLHLLCHQQIDRSTVAYLPPL